MSPLCAGARDRGEPGVPGIGADQRHRRPAGTVDRRVAHHCRRDCRVRLARRHQLRRHAHLPPQTSTAVRPETATLAAAAAYRPISIRRRLTCPPSTTLISGPRQFRSSSGVCSHTVQRNIIYQKGSQYSAYPQHLPQCRIYKSGALFESKCGATIDVKTFLRFFIEGTFFITFFNVFFIFQRFYF